MPNQLGSLGAGGGAAASTLLNDLAFYYKLDEATGSPRVDSTGGTSLTESGTVESTPGKIGDGQAFVGNSANYLSRADSATVSPADTNWTFQVWVKTTAATTSQLCFSQFSATSYGYYFGQVSGWTFQVGNGLTTVIGAVTADTVVAADTWYHILLYHDADNNRVGIQVNGGTIKWANTTGTAGNSTAEFRVGRWAVDASLPMRGTVDELGLWNRILTSSEATELYNGGVGKTYPFDGSGSVSYTTVNVTPPMTNRPARILVPSNYSAGTPTTLVLYFHGASEDETSFSTDIQKRDIVYGCHLNGWIVASSSAYGDAWGNQNSINAYKDFWTYLNANYNINRVVFWSQSMGGLPGLLCVADGTIQCDGWYGIYPVCSLADMFDGNAGVLAGSIRTAYGIAADGSDYAAKTAGHDPLLLAAATFNGVPMRFVASAGDTVVDKTANSDAMATLVTGEATENTVVVASGDHGDSSHFQPSDFIAFVDRC